MELVHTELVLGSASSTSPDNARPPVQLRGSRMVNICNLCCCHYPGKHPGICAKPTLTSLQCTLFLSSSIGLLNITSTIAIVHQNGRLRPKRGPARASMHGRMAWARAERAASLCSSSSVGRKTIVPLPIRSLCWRSRGAYDRKGN